MNFNYYKFLDVDNNADKKTINKAFKKLAMIYHPDKNQNSEESEDLMKKLNEAKEVLLDEKKRKVFDDELKAMEIPKEPEPVVNNYQHSYTPVKFEPIKLFKIVIAIVAIVTLVYLVLKNDEVAVE